VERPEVNGTEIPTLEDLSRLRFSSEHMLLAGLLWAENNSDPLGSVQEIVRTEDFTDERCRNAYACLQRLQDRAGSNRRVALVSTVEKTDPRSYAIPWALWALALDRPEGVPSMAVWHAKAVRDASLVRESKLLATEIFERQVNLWLPDDLDRHLGEAVSGFEELLLRGADRKVSISSRPEPGIVEDILRQGCVDTIRLGLPDLDRLVGRIEASDFLLLAARPSRGKTALGLQIALNVARQGKSVIVFSLEMGRFSLMCRWMANVSEVPLGRIRSGKPLDSDRSKLADAEAELVSLPLMTVDSGCDTVEKVRDSIERAQHIRKIDLVVLDYLGLLNAPGHKDRVQEISHISRALKATARDLGIPILAISQLSRACGDMEHPHLSHLRDSGALEQDADIVLMVWMTEELGVLHCAVEKNRNGPTGTCRLHFDPDIQRIGSLAPKVEILS
jgi:replicative DNA helicase